MPLLDDIDRIEVIRGPGASVWGADAVNGVVNIITKTAGQTKGASVTGGGGTSERAFAQARFGGALTRAIDYRGYLGSRDTAATSVAGGGNAHDGWYDMQGGFSHRRHLPRRRLATGGRFFPEPAARSRNFAPTSKRIREHGDSRKLHRHLGQPRL